MEQRSLGHSGIKVSNLCLGAMTFGTTNETSMMHEIDCDVSPGQQLMAERNPPSRAVYYLAGGVQPDLARP